ncbi:unnamed protein product [Fusarium graminearum]|uniref:Chromosome 1, complete genome n=1 Tax=Gibberella zeae (strain ATCC MYA-4620 / CBS 123657 / FGSC 9075 / NRRL 31084 / PH-1) TaxID=229533 RepID=A0A098DAL1_GIBZE|nr:unnamed protein product [Fusarium graminearum]CZS78249.1 unnamed protein product [Fusarium graminearum]
MASMSWIHNFHKFYRYLLMDMASQGLCSPPGRPDIYGVGVRAAFYTQWLAHNALTPLDIYFLLLFGIGFFLFLMPLCIWRVITRCQPHLDPFLLTNEVHGTFYYLVALTILMATLSMGTWYYTVFLPHLSRGCRDVVFMLGQVNLESKENRRNRARIVWRLRKLRLSSGLIIFTLLIVAIELPILWNHIQGVYDFATITQLLPFVFSIGIFLRSWALYASSANIRDGDARTRPRPSTPSSSSSSSPSSSNGEMVNVVRIYRARSPRSYYPYGYYPYGYNPYGYAQYQDGNPYDDNDDYYHDNYYYNNDENSSEESQEPRWPPGVHYSRRP